MVSSSGTVTQVASNNGGGNQALTPINGGTAPDTFVGLHHMGDEVLASHYAFFFKYACEHQNNTVSDPELSSFISDLYNS